MYKSDKRTRGGKPGMNLFNMLSMNPIGMNKPQAAPPKKAAIMMPKKVSKKRSLSLADIARRDFESDEEFSQHSQVDSTKAEADDQSIKEPNYKKFKFKGAEESKSLYSWDDSDEESAAPSSQGSLIQSFMQAPLVAQIVKAKSDLEN
jgi:hypothetical protein